MPNSFLHLEAFSYPLLENTVCRVHCVRLDLAGEMTQQMHSLLSKEERAKAERFHHRQDRDRFAVLRASLRVQLAKELGASPASIEFAYNSYGKPSLAAKHQGSALHFNVSRSIDFGLVAISTRHEIGADIEALRPLAETDQLVTRFFSQHERAEYANVPQVEKITAFYNCWTRKEAVIKGMGYGLSYPLQDLDVSLTPSKPAEVLRIGLQYGSGTGWRLYDVSQAPQFVAAIAINDRDQNALNESPRLHF